MVLLSLFRDDCFRTLTLTVTDSVATTCKFQSTARIWSRKSPTTNEMAHNALLITQVTYLEMQIGFVFVDLSWKVKQNLFSIYNHCASHICFDLCQLVFFPRGESINCLTRPNNGVRSHKSGITCFTSL